jgi:hypothetical protein
MNGRRTGRIARVAAGVASLVVVAACGGSSGNARAQLLASVQKTTSQSFDAALTVTENITGLSQGAVTVSLPIQIQVASPQVEEATIDAMVEGQSVDVVAIEYDGTAYLSTDGGSTFQTEPGLSSVSEYSAETELQYLQAAGTVTDEGSSTAYGETVENYSATLDPAKLMTALQPELQSLGSELGTELQDLLSAVTISSASVDAALDSSGRIVTLNATIDMTIDGSSLGLPGTMSIAETAAGHYYDYGAEITITPPSSS